MAVYDDGQRVLTAPELVWSGSSCRVYATSIAGGVCNGDIFHVDFGQHGSLLFVDDTTVWQHGTYSGSGKWGRYQPHWSVSGGVCEIIINWMQHACYDCYRRNPIQCVYRLNRR